MKEQYTEKELVDLMEKHKIKMPKIENLEQHDMIYEQCDSILKKKSNDMISSLWLMVLGDALINYEVENVDLFPSLKEDTIGEDKAGNKFKIKGSKPKRGKVKKGENNGR